MYGVHSHVYSRMICGRQPPGRVISNFVSADIGSILFLRRFPLLFGDVFSCVECVWGPRYTDIARAMTRKSSHASTLPTTSVILFAIEWGRNCTKTSCCCAPRFAGENSWSFHVELLLCSLLYAARFSRWIWPLLSSSLYGKERF